MSNTRTAGRRARLLARKRPSATYNLLVEDDADARAELAAAREDLSRAELRVDDDAAEALAAAEKRVERARKAVDACYEPVVMRAMEPTAFEALVAAHPPREDHEERWNEETFPAACFLATVEAGDLSVEEWAQFVKSSLSQGEQVALYAVAIGVNARWPSGAVPND